MLENRESGILVHPTCFPSEYGIGDFGSSAYEFVDFLRDANQRVWQILPLNPTGKGNSPYSSFSTFAGNYLLISPELLIKKGLLSDSDVAHGGFNDRKVDYDAVHSYKSGIFRTAFENFKKNPNNEFEKFCLENSYWLDDYCLFMSSRDYFVYQRKNNFDEDEYSDFNKKYSKRLTQKEIDGYFYDGAWISWPEGLSGYNKSVMDEYKLILKDDIYYNKFLQYEFFEQWTQLKKYANKNRVSIIGDLPIFVAYDSCDVWVNKGIFSLSSDYLPEKIAGVPPDYFSETGQLWGNPLYNWKANKATNYLWWINRIKHNFKSTDILRIDHFRGFESYWEVKFGEETAINGKWVNGPRHDFFDAVKKALGEQKIIAEDLGLVTPEVEKLRQELSFPGMKVLQFAFGYDKNNTHLPHNLKDMNSVIYTGTHDNDTTRGWYEKAGDEARHHYRKYTKSGGEDVAWDFIRTAFSSVAALAVIPIQDIFSLGSEDRMNIPGLGVGNWGFRYTRGMLFNQYDGYVNGLRDLNECFGRNIDYTT